MKLKTILLYLFFSVALVAVAQPKGERSGFNPERFEVGLEQAVIKNAELNQKEQALFLPIFREMRKKQIEVIHSGIKLKDVSLSDGKQCADAIKKHDANDIKLKKIQQAYNQKFLDILPATKVMRIIMAQEEFHRESFRRFSENRHGEVRGQKSRAAQSHRKPQRR